MEIVEERYGRGSTLITSQLPVNSWHEVIGEPTFADAILDRLVHNAYRLALDGPSMRNPETAACRAVRTAADEEGRRRPQRRARSQAGEGSQACRRLAGRGTSPVVLQTSDEDRTIEFIAML